VQNVATMEATQITKDGSSGDSHVGGDAGQRSSLRGEQPAVVGPAGEPGGHDAGEEGQVDTWVSLFQNGWWIQKNFAL
jgi:hypothetical protein